MIDADAAAVRAPCLGALGEESLFKALEAGARSFRFAHGACDTCEWSSGKALFDSTLSSFSSTCKGLGLSPQVSLVRATDGNRTWMPKNSTFSTDRRDLFRMLGRTILRAAAPARAEPEQLGANWKRSSLLRSIRAVGFAGDGELAPDETQFGAVSIGPRCSACRLCALGCPCNALEAVELEGRLALTLEPAACTRCGVCVDICPEDCVTLGPVSVKAVIEGDTRTLRSVPMAVCQGCGASFVASGDRLCQGCGKRKTNRTAAL